jgi:tetratricopeptide (TPR) repeat protein
LVVTRTHVEVLREVSDRHRQFDAEQGGGSCRDSAAAYLRWAHGMLRSRFDGEDTARELKAALSDMYQVVGWACHDLGDHANARRYLTGGLALAREIDDLVLIAGAFYRLGRVSIHQGRAREALKLWQLGQIVAQDSGCLVSVAVLHANEAWAYAMLGTDDRVRDAIARAEGELARVDADTVPSWARFFLAPADIDGIAGVIYNNLAAHEEHRARYAPTAIERAERAYARRQSGETRSRTFDAISLATGYLLDAQLNQMERYGHLAIDMATDVASARAVDRLVGMAALAQPQASHSGVAGVLERIDALASG